MKHEGSFIKKSTCCSSAGDRGRCFGQMGGVAAPVTGWKYIFGAGIGAFACREGREVVWVLCVIFSPSAHCDLIVTATLRFLLPVL